MRWSSLAMTAARGSALPCIRVLAGAAAGAVGAAGGEPLVAPSAALSAGAATGAGGGAGGEPLVAPSAAPSTAPSKAGARRRLVSERAQNEHVMVEEANADAIRKLDEAVFAPAGHAERDAALDGCAARRPKGVGALLVENGVGLAADAYAVGHGLHGHAPGPFELGRESPVRAGGRRLGFDDGAGLELRGMIVARQQKSGVTYARRNKDATR